MKREAGELIEWDDARGFGFIRAKSSPRLFVHISAFTRPVRRPAIGDRVAFSTGTGHNGGPAAVDVAIAGATMRPRVLGQASGQTGRRARGRRIAAAVLLIVVILAALALERAPRWSGIYYAVLGLVSAATYWYDKRQAIADGWRVSEATLHLLDMLGGVIGGLLAQAALHHKTAKPSFGAVTAVIAIIHLCALAALILGFADLPKL